MDFLNETLAALDTLDRDSALRAAAYPGEVPARSEVIAIIEDTRSLLFPRHFAPATTADRKTALYTVYRRLLNQIDTACRFTGTEGIDAAAAAESFVRQLQSIKSLLVRDIEALYEGDPAAKLRDEVLLCYPGFDAISIYRMANVLYRMNVPLIPRMMTEYAHERTGIDIHAGATIGEYFFIDHGTGIVIGETTVIGDHVKLYQGVTLGAKSFELDEEGNPVKGIKRHPNIGSNVIIYANATILGGSTSIGDGCIIGGNTWLMSSVPAGQSVYYAGEH